MKRENKKILSGFTLVEMIITIGIMGILAATVVVSMGPARIAAKVEAAQKEVASEITLAKAYALQGKIQGNAVPCGYGVYFSSNTEYKIYYKTIDNCEEANEIASNRRHSTGSPTDLTTKTLSNGVTGVSGTDIYFTVPNARVHNSVGNEFGGSIDITLTAPGISKNVSVSGSGLVTIGE